jgi:hypothetical protein
MAHIINDIESQLPALQRKVSSTPLWVGRKAKHAITIWNNRTERNVFLYPTLMRYWNSVDYPNWTRDTPWSAAFISYMLKDKGFPGSAAHSEYVQNTLSNTTNWNAYSIPKNMDKLVVKKGDVLVKPRSGGYANSHGDMVYEIKDNKAYLVGGNISDSIGVRTIDLNPDGTIRDAGSYLILLKKNPTSPFVVGLKQFAFWTSSIAIVSGLAYYGYKLYKEDNLPELPKMPQMPKIPQLSDVRMPSFPSMPTVSRPSMLKNPQPVPHGRCLAKLRSMGVKSIDHKGIKHYKGDKTKPARMFEGDYQGERKGFAVTRTPGSDTIHVETLRLRR